MAATSRKPRTRKLGSAPGIWPQPGFQMAALSTPADIAVLGGSAGSGKSFVLLMESARHTGNADFGAVIFRRTSPQIRNEGGLWDTSGRMYPQLGASPREQALTWLFPSGATVGFSHLQHETNIYDHQGAQYPLIGFDELTHFTERQFWYLLSRNRSTCGVKPYVRATCNPEPDSWVARLIAWWIGEDGFPIPDRAGRLRYFVRDNSAMVWGDTPEEVKDQAPHLFTGALANVEPKSLTFVPGSVHENRALLDVDPEYLANLMNQDEEERARLLDGNWLMKTDGLALFDHARVSDLFSNHVPQQARPRRYITCDAAAFGRDLCTVLVWEGWVVVMTVVLRKTDSRDIVAAIEEQRRRWQVAESDVLIDQDGVGGRTLALKPNYNGFHGGAAALEDPLTKARDAYANLKTQCYYRLAERVNAAAVGVTVNDDTVLIDGERTHRLKMGGQVVSVADLLRADLKAVKRAKTDAENRRHINSKEEQKIILNGRSPDLGDALMMREWFELIETAPRKIKRLN